MATKPGDIYNVDGYWMEVVEVEDDSDDSTKINRGFTISKPITNPWQMPRPLFQRETSTVSHSSSSTTSETEEWQDGWKDVKITPNIQFQVREAQPSLEQKRVPNQWATRLRPRTREPPYVYDAKRKSREENREETEEWRVKTGKKKVTFGKNQVKTIPKPRDDSPMERRYKKRNLVRKRFNHELYYDDDVHEYYQEMKKYHGDVRSRTKGEGLLPERKVWNQRLQAAKDAITWALQAYETNYRAIQSINETFFESLDLIAKEEASAVDRYLEQRKQGRYVLKHSLTAPRIKMDLLYEDE